MDPKAYTLLLNGVNTSKTFFYKLQNYNYQEQIMIMQLQKWPKLYELKLVYNMKNQSILFYCICVIRAMIGIKYAWNVNYVRRLLLLWLFFCKLWIITLLEYEIVSKL